ncbi:MAG: 2-isopropylmalate synthase [Myxococcales bacterium]|nr:2-isopropylmalate synthase [Myxococcales bacterium]
MNGARPVEAELIYNWNLKGRRGAVAPEVQFYDETLRDGIQGPSISDPPIGVKLRILEQEEALGIHAIDLGLPGAGPRAVEDVTALARHLVGNNMKIRPSCAARTHVNDIRPIAEISQRTGVPIEVMTFLGTSPIRQYAEDWDLSRLRKLSGEAIEFAVRENLPVTFVTEDTTRSRPETLQPLFLNAIEKGATRLCLCDTVGHATPDGVRNLIWWTRNLIDGTGAEVGIDWHGHNDRGLAVCNAIFAAEFGADRIHGTALGIGERVGNAALDQILINLKLMGEIDNDLTRLVEWCQTVSEGCRWPIPLNYPVIGADAFRTATGVHAAAVIKAQRKGDHFLADRIYSGVPAGLFGKQQTIEIGHMSGLSNVLYWLEQHGVTATDGLGEHILAAAKATNRVLTDGEVHALIAQFWG